MLKKETKVTVHVWMDLVKDPSRDLNYDAGLLIMDSYPGLGTGGSLSFLHSRDHSLPLRVA